MNTIEISITNKIKNYDDFYNLLKEQFLNYEKLEGISDWDDYSFSINCSADQMKFKDMLQIRCIEELTEAREALNDNIDHFKEEISDVINFFMSSIIMLNKNLNDFKPIKDYLPEKDNIDINFIKNIYNNQAFEIVAKIGKLCNLLKNRPWAQTNFLVDKYLFEIYLNDLWETFWTFIGVILGISEKTLFEIIEKKIAVNNWRINTGY